MKRREDGPPTAAEKAAPRGIIVRVNVAVACNIGTSSRRSSEASIMEVVMVVVGHGEFKRA